MIRPQTYPRIDDDKNKFAGYLDDRQLVPHKTKVEVGKLQEIIEKAILYANQKSSRVILDISEDLSAEKTEELLFKAGGKLFNYFIQYCGDPASTAFDCFGRHFSDVAREQFHNRTLQKERMNSGWRYQYIARDMAQESKRFVSISDIGTAEADFNAVIKFIDEKKHPLSIYISVKNRANTMGGQDWPKAISALESIASTDKNRTGPYLCVFGIAMDRGRRIMKRKQKTKELYSVNTEVWLSDFFWPFFTNYSYMEIIRAVIATLGSIETKGKAKIDYSSIPETLISSFGESCKAFKLLDKKGNFNDAERLADLFVMGITNFRKNDKV